MNFRYTIEELQKSESENYLSDLKLIRAIINERRSSCTNYYSPLYKRLTNLLTKVEKAIEKGQQTF